MNFNVSITGLLLRAVLLYLISVSAVGSGVAGAASTQVDENYRLHYKHAVDSINRNDYVESMKYLQMCIDLRPESVQSLQLLGVLALKVGRTVDSVSFLGRAYSLSKLRDLGIIANYIEALRVSELGAEAQRIGYETISQLEVMKPIPLDTAAIMFNLAIVERDLRNHSQAITLLRKGIQINPNDINYWQLCGELLLKNDYAMAETFLTQAVQVFPSSYFLHYLLGCAYQHQQKLNLALESYLKSEQLNEEFMETKANIGAALQSLGKAEQAVVYYEIALSQLQEDSGLLNNYGALMGIMGKHDEEKRYLSRALDMDPNMEPALLNLGGLYQDEGELDKARELLTRAMIVKNNSPLLKLRLAMLMSPVSASWSHMLQERVNMTVALEAFLQQLKTAHVAEKFQIDTSLDRIPFYVAYHGLNDRYLQELIIDHYYRLLEISNVSPVLSVAAVGREDGTCLAPYRSLSEWQTLLAKCTAIDKGANKGFLSSTFSLLSKRPNADAPIASEQKQTRKIRVGIMSKFLGLFEPHGMLLDGMMRNLPRSQFEVIGMPIARSDGKPLAPTVQEASDHVVEISVTYLHALKTIQDAHLDVLIVADTVSEPMTHYLCHARVAPIQIAFWGNPITSASQHIDYFVSADIMEHPFRTRMSRDDEPYTEQVVLLEGQGIWYYRPDMKADLIKVNMLNRVQADRVFHRDEFGLQEDWFVYLLPQSVFKIHPLYDYVLADILRRVPRAHLLVTGGRKPRWTGIYMNRLKEALGPQLSLRLHMIERVSSEQFIGLLHISDVVLHPFPFDGSKTSADALHAGKPMVTLPTEYLRGRMGAAFLRTMNVPELMAKNRSHYVDIAARLHEQPHFYQQVVQAVKENVDLIWEDMEVPYRWYQFLSTALGGLSPMLSYEAFLQQCGDGRDVARELERSAKRDRNRQLFDARWGAQEHWLLDSAGVARLESFLPWSSTPNETDWQQPPSPCIFRDWMCHGIDVVSSVDEKPLTPIVAEQKNTRNPQQPKSPAQHQQMAENSVDAPFSSTAVEADHQDAKTAQFQSAYHSAVEAIHRNDLPSSIAFLKQSLLLAPSHVDSLQLIGVLSLKVGSVVDALRYLDQAYQLNDLQDLGIVANYIEALRMAGNATEGRRIGYFAINELESRQQKANGQYQFSVPDAAGVLFNLAVVELEFKDSESDAVQKAIDLLRNAIRLVPAMQSYWSLCGDVIQKYSSPAQAETFFEEATSAFPQNADFHFFLGIALQQQKKLESAMASYRVSEKLQPNHVNTMINMGSTLHALGRIQEAIVYYEKALPHSQHDGEFFNNFGAVLGLARGRDEDQRACLQRALEIDPNLQPALLNLGDWYQVHCDLPQARELFTRVMRLRNNSPVLRLRIALMFSAVTTSWQQMLEERSNATKSLITLYEEQVHAAPSPTTGAAGASGGGTGTSSAASSATRRRPPLDASMDRTHYYIAYHGFNDRPFQELVAKNYDITLQIDPINPAISGANYIPLGAWQDQLLHRQKQSLTTKQAESRSLSQPQSLQSKVIVGVISRFFGLLEPHGKLVDGIMRYLPRSHFTVIALPIARVDGLPLSPSIVRAADSVIEVSLSYQHVLEVLQKLHLDVLIFAETLNDPITHYLSHSRIAPIQIAFWGSPVTSASKHIDYFVSADIMEHPFRTRMSRDDEPYTEQVVLLEGQGIWYYRPDIEEDLRQVNMSDLLMLSESAVVLNTAGANQPTLHSRVQFGLQEDWFVYLLPQSVFKIHPLYDYVLADILRRVPRAHLVVTAARNSQRSEVYRTRLRRSLGASLSTRLHMIERVSSEQFIGLLHISDVVLHPFPFDGSKTSADALHAGKPMVTLPTEYLRGRMGAAFLRTMNVPELVAKNRSHYVDIAARLHEQPQFYQQVVQAVKENVDLIWEDMEVPYRWYQFLSTALGGLSPMLSYEAFLQQCGDGRDVARELERSAKRDRNRQLFDARWGAQEHWLLDSAGVARLESILDPSNEVVHDQGAYPPPPPCIFLDWKCSGAYYKAAKAPIISSTATSAAGKEQRQQQHQHQPQPASSSASSWRRGDYLPHCNYQLVEPSVVAMARNEYLMFVKSGQHSEALERVLQLYDVCRQDPLYLLEVGAIHIFTGQYALGYHYCEQAEAFVSNSSLTHACKGVAGMYLPDKGDSTVSTFILALQLKKKELEIQQRHQGAHERSLRDSMLYSRVFKATIEALESNLLSSFRIFEKHSECLDWCAKTMQLPNILQGGAYILVLSMIDWSDEAKEDIDAMERFLRGRNLFVPPPLIPTPIGAGLLEGKTKESLPSSSSSSSSSSTSSSYTLWDAVRRVQRESKSLITVANECLSGLSKQLGEDVGEGGVDHDSSSSSSSSDRVGVLDGKGEKPSYLNSIIQDMMVLVGNAERRSGEKANTSMLASSFEAAAVATAPASTESRTNVAASLPRGAALILQLYYPSDPAKLSDISNALWRNLENPAISDIYALNEESFDIKDFPNPHKFHQRIIKSRLTFQDAFKFANEHLPNRTVVLANADIFFDHTLWRIVAAPTMRKTPVAMIQRDTSSSSTSSTTTTASPVDPKKFSAPLENTVLALLKWVRGVNEMHQEKLTLNTRTDSQDAWIFQPPLREELVQQANFHLGAPRCDNRLVHLLEQANYTVLDPAFAIRAIEFDTVPRRQVLYGTQDTVSGTTSSLLLSDRFVFA